MNLTGNSSAIALSLCLILYCLTITPIYTAESGEMTLFEDNKRLNENDLLEELQDVLQKLQRKRLSKWEIKLNQVPRCIIREPCALKRGSRIGKLCDCPPTTSCNFLFLKCL